MGPEFVSFGPGTGPDLAAVPGGRGGSLGEATGVSPPEMATPYIRPSSPDVLTSPPVYMTVRDAIVGGRSLSCRSGRPDTMSPLLNW